MGSEIRVWKLGFSGFIRHHLHVCMYVCMYVYLGSYVSFSIIFRLGFRFTGVEGFGEIRVLQCVRHHFGTQLRMRFGFLPHPRAQHTQFRERERERERETHRARWC
jgi:hypothetical protein